MPDEILVKGTDGKWYLLRGEELLPYEGGEFPIPNAQFPKRELPKGVGKEEHQKFEMATKGDQEWPRVTKGGKESQRVTKDDQGLPGAVIALMPAAQVSHEEHPLRVELEELVDGVIKNSELRMPNEEWLRDRILRNRFRMIVSARLRDVRDTQETREMLIRPVKIGGLGLGIELQGVAPGYKGLQEVGQVLGIIEKAFAEFQAKWQKIEEKRRADWQAKQRQQRQQREQQRVENEQKELEARYHRLTGRVEGDKGDKGWPRVTKGAKGSQRVTKGDKGLPRAPEPPKVLSKPLLMPPPPMVVGDIGSQREPKGDKGNHRVTKGDKGLLVTQNQNQKPKPYTLTPKPSQKITDVRRAPKLLGHIEELSSITLKDFRLLGKDAQEAAGKIETKIQRLAHESLARKMEGIKAWYQSPLHMLYQEISGQIVRETSAPAALLEQRQKDGKATLTQEEYYGIMELNQRLRF